MDAGTPQTSPTGRLNTALALLALVVLALTLRMPGLTRPLVGHFATKNVVYAMIARNWAQGESSLVYPTLDCLADGQPAWHLVEFPAAAYLAGSLWHAVSPWLGGSLDLWGRAVSVACSLVSIGLIGLLAARWHGRQAGWAAAWALALAPVSVIYGQAFMLESSVVLFSLLAFWCCEQALDPRRGRLTRPAAMAGLATSVALLLLTKIYMVVLIPALLARIARASNAGQPTLPAVRRWPAVVMVMLALLPAAAWYANAWSAAAPDNPTAARIFYSVRESSSVHRWPHPILFQPDFYRQLVDDLAGVQLMPVGLALALLGLLDRGARQHAAWLAGMGLLVVALPLKFYEMQYYALVTLPPLCLLVGLGWRQLNQRLPLSRLAACGVLAVALGLCLRYTARPAWHTPLEDRAVTTAAAALRCVAGEQDRVVAMHGSTLDLLYYCGRRGWALDANSPRFAEQWVAARRDAARWVVVAHLESVDQSPAAAELAQLELVEQGDDWRLYRIDAPTASTAARDDAGDTTY